MYCHGVHWRQALIVPIFKKKGDHDDPNCYRGIALISCLAKLFNNILNERLTNFLKKNKVISEFQICFSKKARTADHMFVLRHLIDSHVKQNRKQIFAAFIDFEKAFDTVWRDALLYKLLKAGIHGMMFYMIKSMYEETYYSAKCKDGLTTVFKSTSGVRQGCNLSPVVQFFLIYSLMTLRSCLKTLKVSKLAQKL